MDTQRQESRTDSDAEGARLGGFPQTGPARLNGAPAPAAGGVKGGVSRVTDPGMSSEGWTQFGE